MLSSVQSLAHFCPPPSRALGEHRGPYQRLILRTTMPKKTERPAPVVLPGGSTRGKLGGSLARASRVAGPVGRQPVELVDPVRAWRTDRPRPAGVDALQPGRVHRRRMAAHQPRTGTAHLPRSPFCLRLRPGRPVGAGGGHGRVSGSPCSAGSPAPRIAWRPDVRPLYGSGQRAVWGAAANGSPLECEDADARRTSSLRASPGNAARVGDG